MEYTENISEEQKMSPITAGLTGFIVGVIGTTAIVLSDEDTRKKASKKAQHLAHDLKNWSSKTLHKYEGQMTAVKKDTEEKIDEFKEKKDEAVENLKHESHS